MGDIFCKTCINCITNIQGDHECSATTFETHRNFYDVEYTNLCQYINTNNDCTLYTENSEILSNKQIMGIKLSELQSNEVVK